jgi:hypothetical protein
VNKRICNKDLGTERRACRMKHKHKISALPEALESLEEDLGSEHLPLIASPHPGSALGMRKSSGNGRTLPFGK